MKNKEHHGAEIEVTKDGPYIVSGGVPLGEQWIETPQANPWTTARGKLIQRHSNMLSAAAVSLETNRSATAPIRRSRSTAKKRPAACPTANGRRASRGRQCSSPTLRICAHLQGSVIRKARCGTLSNKPIPPKLENSWSTRPDIVPPAGWWCAIEQLVKPSNRNSNPPLA